MGDNLLSNLQSYNARPEDLTYLTIEQKKAMGVVGEVMLVDSDGKEITSLGGGGAGGGSIVYTNLAGDFVATPNNGTKTITITQLPFVLTAAHVAAGSIKKINVSGLVTPVPVTSITVTGGVITLADADNFASTDTLIVTLIGPDKAYDNSLDSGIQSVLNPEYAHYTSPEVVTTTVGTTTGWTYFTSLYTESFKYGALQFIGVANLNVDITLWATLDETATEPVSGATNVPGATWIDVTNALLGAASINITGATSKMYFLDTPIMPDRLMIMVTIGAASTGTTFTSIYRKY